MARYSFATYGSPNLRYGQVENNRAYYNVSLFAWSYTYNAVSLIWGSVLTDPLDPAPTHWKLVKNTTGNPDTPYDAEVVDQGTISEYRLSAIDSDLVEGQQIIYSFWIFNGVKWINCGYSDVITVGDSGTLGKVEKWIPSAWLNAIAGTGDATGEPSDLDLNKILSAYTFFYDSLRAKIQLLESSMSYKDIPIQFLKSKIQDLGFNYEPVLGDIYHRSLYRIGDEVNSEKGTTIGIKEFTTALTHWNSRVSVGKNLLLDYNDSSFEESAGRWSTTAGTVQHLHFTESLSTVGVLVAAPTPTINYNYGLFGPRSVGFGWVHGHNTSPVLTLPASSSDIIKYGVPVKPNTRYLFSGYFRVKDTTKAGSAKVKISWYNQSGTLISTTLDGTAVTLTSSWQQVFSKSDSGTNGQLAPSNAYYAQLTITFTNSSNQAEYIMDMFQFEVVNGSSTYEDARKAIVYVEGETVNYIHNPSFESNTNGWTALNGTLTTATSPSGAIVFGSKFAKLTASSDGRTGITSEWMPIDPNENYTFSAHVSSNTTKVVKARIEFSSALSQEEQNTILTDEDGSYYSTAVYYVDSDPLTLSATPQRLHITALAPDFSTDAGYPLAKVSLYVDDAVSGEMLYIDALQLEDSLEPTSYFDGSGAPAITNPLTQEYIDAFDCLWEDETNSHGRSYRWQNYANKLARLAANMVKVVPNGSSWEIRSGFPTPAYQELSPSVLTAPSFEQSTTGWNGGNATISRSVTRGSLFDEYTTHGSAFGKVTSTNGSSTFSAYTDNTPIVTNAGYYASIAVKPENEDAYGNYTLEVKFYDDFNIVVTTKTASARNIRFDRWGYLGVFAQKSEIYGATYAVLKVTCTPDSPAAGRVFYLDRVVFRQ
jgi:hypothetical protein